jgi:glucose-1-phosphate adenylyltransferase
VQATCAVVLAGGRGSRLRQLTDERAKPAMPFAGTLKIIDFTLSNCLNSGVRRVSVLTQYKSQELIRHLMRGWNLAGVGSDEFVDIVPAQQQTGEGWYQGTADAIHQNLGLLSETGARFVLVLAGDHVYKMDYRCIVADHVRHDADVTVACIEVPVAQACEFGVIQVDDDGRIRAFQEKPGYAAGLPGCPDRALVSMGIYVFSASFLHRELHRDAADPLSRHDFGCDIFPALIGRARAFAHDFSRSCVGPDEKPAYWRDVGTLDGYWQANMDMTGPAPGLDLNDPAWPVRSRGQLLPPARFLAGADGHGGTVTDSLVAGGSVVTAATLRRSVLSTNVLVGEGSVVEDSLLLPSVVLGCNVLLRRAIVDQDCVLPDGIRIGECAAEDRSRFMVTEEGVTLVTARMLGRCAPGGASGGRVCP